MKKTLRFMLMLMAGVLTIGASFSDPIIAQAFSQNFIVMTASLPTNVDIADGLKIPYNAYSSGWTDVDVKIRVTMPNGIARVFNTKHLDSTAEEYTSSDNKYFVVNADNTISPKYLVAGEYRIEYLSASEGVSVVTESHIVTVKQTKYSLRVNDDKIIPSVAKKGAVVTLPSTAILDEDDNIVTTTVGSVVATVSRATNSGAEEVSVTDNTFTATETGTYTVTYKLMVNGKVMSSQSFSMVVKEDFEASESVKLNKATYNYAFPTATDLYLNEEYTFPTATVENSVDGKTAQTYVKFEIKAPNGEWTEVTDRVYEKNSAGKYELVGFKYTPTTAGQYGFRYTFTDFYGSDALTIQPDVVRVTDHKAPVVMMVKAYDKTTATKDTVIEDQVNLRSIQGKGYSFDEKDEYTTADNDEQGIYFPAIFGYDETDGNDVELKRTFKYNGHVFDIDEYQKSVNGTVDHSKAVYYKFTKAEKKHFKSGAEYTVIYEAKDKGTGATKQNSSTFQINGTQPVIVIYNEDVLANDATAPLIADFSVTSQARLTDTIAFDMPSIVDYNGTDSEKVDDTRVESHVMWFVGDAENITTNRDASKNRVGFKRSGVDIEAKEIEVKDDKVEFTLPEDFDVSANNKITIAVYAVDDAGNETVTYKTIKIVNTADSVKPVVITDLSTAFSALTSATYENNDEVTIPTIEVFDENSENLETIVNVYGPNGELVELIKDSGKYETELNASYTSKTGVKKTIRDFKFKTTSNGKYTIVYNIKDAGSNILAIGSYTTCLTEIPEIKVNCETVTIQVGDYFEIPQAEVYVNNEKVVADITTNIASSIQFAQDGNRIRAIEAGEIVVTYSAKYNGKDANKLVKRIVVSKDTTAPVITVNGSVEPTAKLNEIFKLPDFTITEANGIKKSGIKIESSKSSAEITAEYNDEEGYWYFTPTNNGAYTITYYAIDEYGNESAATQNVTKFTVQAGDVTPPTIKLNDGAIVFDKANKTLKIDTSKIAVTDVDYNGNTVTLDADDLEIVLTNEASSTIVSSSKNGTVTTYDLTDVGKYTLTISATDDADLTNSQVKTYTITAEAKDAGMSNDVLGSILIVSSLVLLGGVIIYFIVTDKKGSKIKK